MFKIIEGPHAGKSLTYNRNALILDKLEIPWENIEEIDLVDAQVVKKSDSIVFGALGAVVGGPIGAAVGASLGGLSRPCTFFIRIGDKEKLIASGWKMHFNKMMKCYKIKKLMQDT